MNPSQALNIRAMVVSYTMNIITQHNRDMNDIKITSGYPPLSILSILRIHHYILQFIYALFTPLTVIKVFQMSDLGNFSDEHAENYL